MTSEELLTKVRSYLAKTGESESAFGKRVLNDPAFLLKLERGRKPYRDTIDKVVGEIRQKRNGKAN